MRPQIARLRGRVADFFFPRWCVGCGREGDFICPSCLSSQLRLMPPVCPKCGRPQASGNLCPACINWRSSIDGIRAPFQFAGVIREAVHQLKYNNIRALAEPLGKLLGDYFQANPLPAEVLVPVPLHPKRLRQRGYNQSGLLARQLSELGGLPVVDDCLIRRRQTVAQAETTSVIERRNNVIDAFLCHGNKFQDKMVVLIDDVSTSGATLDACARALKEGGARSVWGLVIAREI